MIGTKLIMLEGLPSTGKTTNSQFLQMQLGYNGANVKWIHEVAHPHPTIFFDEAIFTRDEYILFLRTYSEAEHFLNSIASFRKSTVGINLLEIEWNFMNDIKEDIFQALKKFAIDKFSHNDKYKIFSLEKWADLTKKILSNNGEIQILDSAIFQFYIFWFLLNNRSSTDLEAFVHEILKIIKPLDPCLIYFYRDDVEATINYLEKDRGTQTLINIWERDKSLPYYQNKPTGAEGFKQFLRDYSYLAKLLYNSSSCKKVSIEISKGEWTYYENKMLSFLGIDRISSPNAIPQNGIYRNEALNFEIKVDGLTIIDPVGKTRKLIPKSTSEFYIECLPVILQFENSRQIITAGLQIVERWTKIGTRYKKMDS
jgi:hypothetical protein